MGVPRYGQGSISLNLVAVLVTLQEFVGVYRSLQEFAGVCTDDANRKRFAQRALRNEKLDNEKSRAAVLPANRAREGRVERSRTGYQ